MAIHEQHFRIKKLSREVTPHKVKEGQKKQTAILLNGKIPEN